MWGFLVGGSLIVGHVRGGAVEKLDAFSYLNRVKSINQLYKELHEMPEFKIIRLNKAFTSLLSFFNENFGELEKELLKHIDLNKGKMSNPPYLNSHLVGRLLHNYIASAYSLYETNKTYITKIGYDSKLLNEIQQKQKEHFGTHGLSRFIIRFRVYLQKIGSPVITLVFNFLLENPKVVIEQKVFLEWDDWNEESTEYIKNQNYGWDIHSELSKYRDHVNTYYSWLKDFQLEVHKSELDLITKKQNELRAAVEKDLGNRI